MGWLKGFDRRVFHVTLRFSPESFTHKLMKLISRSGDLGFIWILLSFLLAFWSATRPIAWLCLVTLVATTLLGEGVLKHIFRRPRPYVTHGPVKLTIPVPTGFSFPSGHTASSVACARILALLGPNAALAAYAYALLMGLSRVYLRAHYVSDVVAGGMVGFLCAEAIQWIMA